MPFRIADGTSCSNPQSVIRNDHAEIEEITDPLSPLEEPDEPSDLDDFDAPCTDDDSQWDAFIPDDDEFDPLPDPGDFWTTQD